MADYNMQRAYDLGVAMGSIRTAIIYLESVNSKTRAEGLAILRKAIAELDANEKIRADAIFAKLEA